jgi:glycosyltransferase involved in cell wall biosynthesis
MKSIIFLFQLYILKLLKIKFVWTIHNLTHHEDRHKEIELFFCRFIGNLADAIITHCDNARKEVARVFRIKQKNKIYIIPHGNYINFYANKISAEKAKKKLMLSGNVFYFLFLGEIRPYKGIKELIYTFKKFNHKERLSIGLIIAGRPKNNAFAQEIKKHINGTKNIYLILDYISNSDLQIYLNAVDIIVFPYRNVSTSGGILLAMSFGKAIIAPCIGCIQNVLDRDGSYLYDPTNPNGLYKSMKKAVREKSHLTQMGSHNLNLAKRFNWINIAKKTKNLYFDLLKI